MQNQKSTQLQPLLRLRKVMELTGRRKTSIYGDIKNGVFPKPIKIGKRSIAWTMSSISSWISSKTGEEAAVNSINLGGINEPK